jgi:VPDSG-CTERM motif
MKSKILLIAGTVAVMAVAGSAYAVPEITLSVNGVQKASQNSPGNLAQISYTGSSGIFTIASYTGTLLESSVTSPQLDLATLDISTAGTGTLTLDFEYLNIGPLGTYTLTPGAASIVNNVGGTVGIAWNVIETSTSVDLQAVISSTGKGGKISADGIVTVPDGGTTAILLGMALCGMALMFARKARMA